MVRCNSCGREVSLRDVSYIRGDLVVCRNCFPNYYVRNICPIVNRRLRGEHHVACTFCKYKSTCDGVIEELKEIL